MPETSTTPVDNPTNDDAAADSTTVTDPNTGTDNQPADNGDNLDDASKSTDKPADDDKKSTGDKTDDAPASKLDDDIDEWIEKKGFPKATTDEEKQAYQAQRNEQREFTRERMAQKDAAQAKKDADDLSQAIADAKPDESDEDDDDLDPLEKRQNDLEEKYEAERTTRLQSEFFNINKVTPEESKLILDIMKEKFARPTTPEGKKMAFDIWSKPDALPDLLDLAKARISQAATDTVANEAAQAERERIARESQATSPGRGAKTTSTGDKTPEQERLERFSNWD